MLLNARNNLFKFSFPKGFFDKDIKDKYERYLKNTSIPFKTLEGFINHTIQSVTFPDLSANLVEQKGKYNVATKFRGGFDAIRNLNRTFTVEFKHVDAFLNYYALIESFFKFHEHQAKVEFLPDISLTLYNSDILGTVKVNYGQILYEAIPSALSLNYSDVRNSFKTFSVTFAYNTIEFDFDFIED